MIIGEAFEILKAAGCVSSQREFSTSWCGKRPSYYSSTLARATARTPSVAVLLTLYSRLRNHIVDAQIADPAQWQPLEQVADAIWIEVMDRVCGPHGSR